MDKIWNWIRSTVIWILWLLFSFFAVLLLIALSRAVWPDFVAKIVPAVIIMLSDLVLLCLLALLAIYILIALVRGLRITTMDLIEFWDNLKDGKAISWIKGNSGKDNKNLQERVRPQVQGKEDKKIL